MKKVIGILGIAVVAMVLFANTNGASNNTDFDLASLMELNTANAECIPWSGFGGPRGRCLPVSQNCVVGYYGDGNPCDPALGW